MNQILIFPKYTLEKRSFSRTKAVGFRVPYRETANFTTFPRASNVILAYCGCIRPPTDTCLLSVTTRRRGTWFGCDFAPKCWFGQVCPTQSTCSTVNATFDFAIPGK